MKDDFKEFVDNNKKAPEKVKQKAFDKLDYRTRQKVLITGEDCVL